MPDKRVVLITGAAGGLGRAIARRFAQDGYRLIVTDIGDLTAVTGDLRARADDVWSMQCDLAQPSEIEAFVESAEKQFGRVDVLVNNAAWMKLSTLQDFSPEAFEMFYKVNVTAPVLLSLRLATGMVSRQWGRIVNIVSSTAYRPAPGGFGYSTSKAALISATKGLAAELGQSGITVNCISPSFTGHSNIPAAMVEAVSPVMVAMQAIKRPATPEDFVGSIAFLASDDAAFMTGQTLVTDGGGYMIG